MLKRISVPLVAAIAIGLSACGGSEEASEMASANYSCSTELVHPDAAVVTMWAWYPAFEHVINHFNEENEDVQICWNNVGVNIDEYTRFNTALEAGEGAPDIIMLESAIVPSYIVNEGIINLDEYGIDELSEFFSEGALADVSTQDGQFAVPIDGGPMGMLVREDIFEEYGIEVPETWDEFAAAAQQMKDAGYDGTITNFPLNGKAFIQAMFANNGADPYAYDGTEQTVSINLQNDSVVEVLEYWKTLADAGVVSTNDRTTPEDNARLLDGSYATYLAAAWGPGYLMGLTEEGVPDGEWRAYPLPQWNEDERIEVNWGGSSFAVTAQARDPELSASVVKEIFNSEERWELGVEESALFPIWQNILQAEEFRERPYEFFGGQAINDDVFVDAAEGYEGFTNTPFQNYVYDVTNKVLADFFADEMTAEEAAQLMQEDLEGYAQRQGFNN